MKNVELKMQKDDEVSWKAKKKSLIAWRKDLPMQIATTRKSFVVNFKHKMFNKSIFCSESCKTLTT